MVKVEDILTRLQNGEDATDIANELCDVLNEATTKYEKEQKKIAEAAAKDTKKLADLQVIIDLIHDFCIEYYCEDSEDIDIIEEAFKDIDAKTVSEMIDEIGNYAVKLVQMQDSFEKLFEDLFPTKSVQEDSTKDAVKLVQMLDKDEKAKDADKVIADFLASIGLK